MPKESIKSILMKRDGLTAAEAAEEIKLAKETLAEYIAEGDTESAFNICEECFGLEPDYLMELM